MEKWEGSELNKAKEILAIELTKLVHSEEEAIKAQEEIVELTIEKKKLLMRCIYPY